MATLNDAHPAGGSCWASYDLKMMTRKDMSYTDGKGCTPAFYLRLLINDPFPILALAAKDVWGNCPR